MYDSRLAKFLSIDNFAKKYPFYTPYQFASNSPISGMDLDGKEFVYYQVINTDQQSGKCTIKKTGEKDYKNWILNLTDGLWGLCDKGYVHVACIEGPDKKHYLFADKELNNINIKDFNPKTRYTVEGIDAISRFIGIVGDVLSGSLPAKNEPISTGCDGAGKFEDVCNTVKSNVNTNVTIPANSGIATTEYSGSKSSSNSSTDADANVDDNSKEYDVITGSFQSFDNASKYAKENGWTVLPQLGEKSTRVSAGTYKTKKEAQEAQKNLPKGTKSWVLEH